MTIMIYDVQSYLLYIISATEIGNEVRRNYSFENYVI